MVRRGTRSKIRFQAEKAVNDVDRAVEHLSKVDIIADGRSQHIDETLPKLVVILTGVRNMISKWRDTL